jgi:tRNA nucleotidyltransferase (CCA-adding enzyme)
MPCYLVGGPVRDLVLGRSVDDLDLVFEGDAIAAAERFVAAHGGTITRHAAFVTAKVELPATPHGFHLDFITARTETYPEPAALPVVRPSTIAHDLRRRDISIKTLAIRLTAPHAFELVDLLGGMRDLEQGQIRILHDDSFVDDPTRIVRAARFAARLGYRIEEGTERSLIAAVQDGMIERTTPARILHEFWLSLDEPAPQAVWELLQRYDAVRHIFPGLVWTSNLSRLLAAIRTMNRTPQQRHILSLELLAWALPPSSRQAALARYQWTREHQRAITQAGELDISIAQLEAEKLRPSEIDRILRGASDGILDLAELIAPPRARANVAFYRTELRPTATLLDGDDLRALGIRPGPRYRILLDDLRAMQLDGQIRTRTEAEVWVMTKGGGLCYDEETA